MALNLKIDNNPITLREQNDYSFVGNNGTITLKPAESIGATGPVSSIEFSGNGNQYISTDGSVFNFSRNIVAGGIGKSQMYMCNLPSKSGTIALTSDIPSTTSEPINYEHTITMTKDNDRSYFGFKFINNDKTIYNTAAKLRTALQNYGAISDPNMIPGFGWTYNTTNDFLGGIWVTGNYFYFVMTGTSVFTEPYYTMYSNFNYVNDRVIVVGRGQ